MFDSFNLTRRKARTPLPSACFHHKERNMETNLYSSTSYIRIRIGIFEPRPPSIGPRPSFRAYASCLPAGNSTFAGKIINADKHQIAVGLFLFEHIHKISALYCNLCIPMRACVRVRACVCVKRSLLFFFHAPKGQGRWCRAATQVHRELITSFSGFRNDGLWPFSSFRYVRSRGHTVQR